MAKLQKVRVSERALFARVDRELNKKEERLRRCRPSSRDYHELGNYYVINWRFNGITAKDIDLEGLARKLGVLKEWEAGTP
jgi:hypothetical protein